ncbi:MAG: DUF1501 domain-containing protein, partial [bacterium]|nr:DUF1501 domain-containing protein [bacterium]
MNLNQHRLQSITRRAFLGKASVGIGAAALHSMLAGEASAAKSPVAPGKAKHVIYIHLAGSPSQIDLFDHKPVLTKNHGKACPVSFTKGKRFAFIRGTPNFFGSPFKFQQHGDSGAWVSELLPEFAKRVDDVAFIRSCHTDQFNHAPAQLYLHTGSPLLGGASMGSWATWGLGALTDNLPAFVVLVTGGKQPSAGKSVWGSGFLPSVCQGVQCRTTGDPVLFLNDPPGLDRVGRRQSIDAIEKLNRLQYEEIGDDETLTRIEQFRLAFQMQMTAPEVMDISREPKHILDLYGAKPGHQSTAEGKYDPRAEYRGDDAAFANSCLLARRLVENGVRFVQLYDWGWDHHGAAIGEDLPSMLPVKCRQVDRAIGGLLTDLKQRGLLDETLVVFSGEFGRTPMRQSNVGEFTGRDHHPFAFTVWMAGGGVKAGVQHGQTDEFGYAPIRDAVSVRDLQATILHLVGLDAHQHSFEFKGLQQR